MNGAAEEPVRLEGFAPQDLYQQREKIFTRYVGGFYQKLRFYTGWPLLLGYFATPWLTWGDRQAVLFDLPARQFHLFGITLWPQDLWLLGMLLMIAAFGLFTVTTIVGRLWCGYTCPQTVWTSVYMWAEQITEGSRNQRIKLDKAAWSWNKIRRRSLKHLLWFGFALLTGITFVGYFSPIAELSASLVQFSSAGWPLLWVLVFTIATYVNAGWLREQVCLYMCPYARFQSAMVDMDTLVVSYDAARGEPRGSRRKNDSHELGDCVNCQLCVQVCPTGIDIRNGLQYECIGCAHCIDACAVVMQKMSYPSGLIRYSTERALQGGGTHWLRGRSVGYAAATVLLSGALIMALFSRTPFAFDVLRERGELFRKDSSGVVYNDYQLKIMNKSQASASYVVELASEHKIAFQAPLSVTVGAGELDNLSLELFATEPLAGNVPVEITICQKESGQCATETTTFMAPL